MKLEIITQKPDLVVYDTPILFIHGYWHGAWCWEEHFMTYFAKNGYTSYALNLRGHGKSEGSKKLQWTSLADYVEDLVQAIDQLGVSPILIGHSMGGMIIQKYLELGRKPVPAAVLLASAPPNGLLSLNLRMLKRNPLSYLKTNLTLNSFHFVATIELYRDMLFSNNLPKDKLIEYHKHLQKDSIRAFMDIMFLDLPHPEKITPPPMLVLGADDDTVITPKNIEDTANSYGVMGEGFPNMGHGMMLDVGWQSVADRILEWLRKQKI